MLSCLYILSPHYWKAFNFCIQCFLNKNGPKTFLISTKQGWNLCLSKLCIALRDLFNLPIIIQSTQASPIPYDLFFFLLFCRKQNSGRVQGAIQNVSMHVSHRATLGGFCSRNYFLLCLQPAPSAGAGQAVGERPWLCFRWHPLGMSGCSQDAPQQSEGGTAVSHKPLPASVSPLLSVSVTRSLSSFLVSSAFCNWFVDEAGNNTRWRDYPLWNRASCGALILNVGQVSSSQIISSLSE